MLHFRGVINVALFWVLANVKNKRADFIGKNRRRRCPEHTTREKRAGNDQGKPNRQPFGLSQKTFQNHILMFHKLGEA